MVRIKVYVDESCIGCGACISIAPDIFEFNEEGFSHPKIDIIEDDEKTIKEVKEAEETCPVKAIKIKKI